MNGTLMAPMETAEQIGTRFDEAARRVALETAEQRRLRAAHQAQQQSNLRALLARLAAER